jgi:hypothetical protein
MLKYGEFHLEVTVPVSWFQALHLLRRRQHGRERGENGWPLAKKASERSQGRYFSIKNLVLRKFLFSSGRTRNLCFINFLWDLFWVESFLKTIGF